MDGINMEECDIGDLDMNRRSVQPSPQADFNVLQERVRQNESDIEALTAQVARVAEQVGSLSTATQVMATVAEQQTRHLNTIETNVQSLSEIRYQLEQRLGIIATDIARLQEMTKDMATEITQLQSHNTSFGANLIFWVLSGTGIVISIISVIASHWR
jgi:chromosome segregation ATPase